METEIEHRVEKHVLGKIEKDINNKVAINSLGLKLGIGATMIVQGGIDANRTTNNKEDVTGGSYQVDIQLELHKTPWGELLYGVANGTLKKFQVYNKFAVGVIMGGAGMPFEIAYDKYGRNLPIIGINKKNKEHIKLAQVCKKDGNLYTAGSGYVLTVNGSGKTMEAARRRAYERVNQITIPNAVYRLDIGSHWKKEESLLRSWGYL